jgi:hypothetical protein
MESSYFENKGKGVFERKALPLLCQASPIFGMLNGDYDGDGNLDILITGNSNSTEVSTGAYDAMNGILLSGDGKGNFVEQNSRQTGFKTPGDMKGIATLKKSDGSLLILAMPNSGQLQSFQIAVSGQEFYEAEHTSEYALVSLKNGKTRKQEFYWGNAYLSSSDRVIWYDKQSTTMIEVYDVHGMKTKLIRR